MVLGGCGAQSDDSSGGSTTGMTGPGTSSETGEAPTSGGESSGGMSTGGASTGGGTTGGSTGGSTGGTETGGTETGETTGGGCIGCAASFMGADGELCEASQAKLDALFMCVCGTCADVCADTCTMGAPSSPMCQTCQTDAFAGACARDLMACLADE